jgi:hypothetical protein
MPRFLNFGKGLLVAVVETDINSGKSAERPTRSDNQPQAVNGVSPSEGKGKLFLLNEGVQKIALNQAIGETRRKLENSF